MRRLSLCLLFCLSGCLSLTHEEMTENMLCIPEVKTGRGPFVQSDWPAEAWWQQFGSPELDALIVEAIDSNPSLKAIEQKIEVAKQEAVIARSKYMPLLFFNWSDQWQFISKNGLYRAFNPELPRTANLIDLAFSFTYELDFWGKYHNLYKAAIGREQAEKAEAAQVKLIISTGLAQAFFALKTNLVRQNLYQELYAAKKNIAELQKLLSQSALFFQIPVDLADEDVLEAEKLLLVIEQEIATNVHLINMLRGQGPDAPLELNIELPFLPERLAVPETLQAELLARRPDLMAQIWRVEALAKEVGAARADYYPNFNIAGLLGWQSFHYSNLFSLGSGEGTLNPAMSLPVYTAGAIGANIDAKKALFNEAVYEYNDRVLKSVQEIADLLVFATSVYEQREKQTGIVTSAKNRYDLTLLRQQSGLDNALQAYAFQIAWIEKRIEEIQLVYSQYLAAVKLIKALGGGYNG